MSDGVWRTYRIPDEIAEVMLLALDYYEDDVSEIAKLEHDEEVPRRVAPLIEAARNILSRT